MNPYIEKIVFKTQTGVKIMNNEFSSKKEALRFLSEISWLDIHTNDTKFSTSNTYCLSHGEYSRPDYYPRRYKNGWAIAAEYFYYSGTFNTMNSGRMDEDTFSYLFLESR